MGDNIVHLIDRVPGISAADNEQLFDWLRLWGEHLKKQENAESIILIVETKDGELHHVCQSIGDIDRARMVGLLVCLTHKIMSGFGKPPELEGGVQ